MHTNETPDPNHESSEVSAADVPINHMMDINNSDSDFDDSEDEDEDNRDYQLLSTQEVAEGGSGQSTVYYPHNYSVEWIDWDQYEQTLEDNTTIDPTVDTNTSPIRSDAGAGNHISEDTINRTAEPSNQRQNFTLSDDRIDVIKTLMTGFILPKDNIPVWAQELPEEQWKELLSGRISPNKSVDDK